MSSFRFESSCARDGGMWWIILHRGGPYLVVLSSGCGDFIFTMSHTATRASWPYMDTSPPPGTDVTKKLKFIYGHDDALVAVWLMVKKSSRPEERTTKYDPPRCNMIHHIPPSRSHDDSKRKDDISHKLKNINKFKKSKFKKQNSKIFQK